MQESAKEAGLKIRVVERAGRSLKNIQTKSDSPCEDKCNENNCKVCMLNLSANCKGRGVVYQMKCQGCTERSVNDGLQIGETAGSIGERMSEHRNKYELKDKTQFFANTLKRSIGVKDNMWK